MFDELKILITGDTSGIESSMKKALNIVTGGVDKMNDQEVDWTSIFSRAVSPAIISSVASVFAFAISQSVNFQAAMAQTGTAAGDSSAQIGQLSQSALNLSTQVPASAQDIANAMAQVSAVFNNTGDQQAVVAAMAELAASGFGNLSDIVKSSIPLFKQFGVTTEAQAINVLTSLMHSAEAAKESIPELAGQFTTFSDQLPASAKNLDAFNGLISTFGAEVKDLGSTGAQAIFSALATSSSNMVGPMELLGVSFTDIQKSLLSDGGLSAIERTSVALEKMGPSAALIATNFGLTATQVGQFQTNAQHLPQVAIDAKAIATNTQTIGQAYDDSQSSLRNFQILWNHFVADMVGLGTVFSPFVNGFAGALNTMLTDADSFFKDITDGLGSAFSPLFGNTLVNAAQGTFDGLSKAFTLVSSGIQNQIVNGIGGALGLNSGASSGLNSALQGTGVGFSNSALSRIDQTASQSGLVSSLVSALQTGIKGGQYTQLTNTFNLSVPQGGGGLTAKQIAQQLYNQFNGTQ